jgi:hypothetical protein
MTPSTLSPQHFRRMMEATVGPLTRLVQQYKDEPDKLHSLRSEIEALITEYFDWGSNVMRQQFLDTRG